MVYAWLAPTAAPRGANAATAAPPAHPDATATMWLLLADPAYLVPADVAYRAALERICPEVPQATGLVQAFVQLVRARRVTDLDGWRAAAETSDLRELRRFAVRLRQDDAAVRAALDHPWSQGQVEGQITRLKLVKRQMYGRANFDLLRLLHRS